MGSRLAQVLRAGEAHRQSVSTGGKKKRGAGYDALMQRALENANAARQKEIDKRAQLQPPADTPQDRISKLFERAAAKQAAKEEEAAREAAAKAEKEAEKEAAKAEKEAAKTEKAAEKEAARQAREAVKAAKLPQRRHEYGEPNWFKECLSIAWPLHWYKRKARKEEETDGYVHEDTKVNVKKWEEKARHRAYIPGNVIYPRNYEYLMAWWEINRDWEAKRKAEDAAFILPHTPAGREERAEINRRVEALNEEWRSKMRNR